MKKTIAAITINVILIGNFLPAAFAQEQIPINTQRKVVSEFKINDFENYFPFPDSSCPDKHKGDANCDNQIDLFDLSIWEIELSNEKGRKADFTNDGNVNLADFAVWKKTYYGNSQTQETPLVFLNFLKELLDVEANAQSGTPQTTISNSQPVTSINNTAIIFNTNSDGTSSQIQFDANSNPISSLLLDITGNPQGQATFLKSGDEVVTTFQDGVTVQTLKKSEGPLFQFFSDSSGKMLAVKSWPTLDSIANGDPPLAVTLPTKNNRYLTLSINPNGTGIFTQSDNEGNILTQSQSRPSGVYISQDLRLNITTESNTKIGLSTIQMPNNLGGNTTYHLYKSGLFAVVQTDGDNNYYLAKPLNDSGDSWNFTSSINGLVSEKTVADPIAEVSGGTPSAKEIVGYINFYQSLPQNNNSLNFKDGFGTSAKIAAAQLNQANDVLKIESAVTPDQVLGISEVSADQLDNDDYTPPGQNNDNEGNSRRRTGGDDDQRSNNSGASAAAAATPAQTTQARVGIGNNSANVTVNADGSQTTQVTGANGSILANGTTSTQNANNTMGSGGTSSDVNFDVVSRFIPITSSGGTPVLGTPVVEENTYKSNSSCFLAGTKISTPLGPVAIETLKPGMKVYSYNDLTKEKEVSDFAGLDINLVNEYLIINGKIETTMYHPFYILDNRTGLLSLRKAGTLKTGDLMVGESGEPIEIKSIQKIIKKETVYNLLTVTPNDNFYAEGILVHNYNNDKGDDGSNGDTSSNNNDTQSFDSSGNQNL
jgi:hypothetical protein